MKIIEPMVVGIKYYTAHVLVVAVIFGIPVVVIGVLIALLGE